MFFIYYLSCTKQCRTCMIQINFGSLPTKLILITFNTKFYANGDIYIICIYYNDQIPTCHASRNIKYSIVKKSLTVPS